MSHRRFPASWLVPWLRASAVLSVVSLWGATAQAQSAATCSGTIGGTAVTGTIFLDVPTPVGTLRVDPSKTDGSAGGVFNRAECECQSYENNGILMTVQMTTPIPLSVSGQSLSYWVGTGSDCTSAVNQQNSCYQLQTLPSGLNLERFQSTSFFSIPLPADILTKPVPPRTCDNVSQASIVNILIGASADPVPVTCKLSVAVNTIPPTITHQSEVSVASGDGALVVSFPTETSGVRYYQVLCRDKAVPGTPLDVSTQFANKSYFSTCVDGVIKRRIEVPGSSVSGSTDDAGVTTTDLGFARAPVATTQSWRAPATGWGPLDVNDMADATLDMASATPDMAAPTADMTKPDPFHQLDPSFLCSDKITGGGGTASARIDGLVNEKSYEVLVVAIDAFGNATPFDIQIGEPKPAQNLGEALGSSHLGFGCAVGGGRGAGAAAPLAGLLLLLGLLGRRRLGGRA